ncbi:hypothetical protein BDV96DRAFT_405010 [Lophiotrema nucula]|uniref:Uncharacterized protein n=1 Tax=Lophiotrema nucula TaxID=690887 RepID=A0A6A5ZEB6_9PLEO|nr:hypothetical protein BDV96DRAFT_405010 [Lophiotrema nucula]
MARQASSLRSFSNPDSDLHKAGCPCTPACILSCGSRFPSGSSRAQLHRDTCRSEKQSRRNRRTTDGRATSTNRRIIGSWRCGGVRTDCRRELRVHETVSSRVWPPRMDRALMRGGEAIAPTFPFLSWASAAIDGLPDISERLAMGMGMGMGRYDVTRCCQTRCLRELHAGLRDRRAPAARRLRGRRERLRAAAHWF